VLEAMREWRVRHGRLPSSYDWSRTHARRRGGEALDRIQSGDWPSGSVVTRVLGSWAQARAVADGDATAGGCGVGGVGDDWARLDRGEIESPAGFAGSCAEKVGGAGDGGVSRGDGRV
jgi:hypothetical protein